MSVCGFRKIVCHSSGYETVLGKVKSRVKRGAWIPWAVSYNRASTRCFQYRRHSLRTRHNIWQMGTQTATTATNYLREAGPPVLLNSACAYHMSRYICSTTPLRHSRSVSIFLTWFIFFHKKSKKLSNFVNLLLWRTLHAFNLSIVTACNSWSSN